MTNPEDARTAELAGRLADLESRVAAACRAASRQRDELTVVAVTKTFPAADVRRLAGLGVTDVGENRHQEAAAKHADCADLDLRWHFVGSMQRNKARSVAAYADVVHSVDRSALVRALSAAAVAHHRALDIFVQVSLEEAPSPGRGGAAPDEVAALADAVADSPGLRLTGVMGVAPLPRPGAPDADTAFAQLAGIAAAVRDRHPGAIGISAGMSGDLEVAVRHGATHLRVGTALLGGRTRMVR